MELYIIYHNLETDNPLWINNSGRMGEIKYLFFFSSLFKGKSKC